jgi:predicted house-cleaning noncanonical NTP pyrophosphatase (MazG superfamily)
MVINVTPAFIIIITGIVLMIISLHNIVVFPDDPLTYKAAITIGGFLILFGCLFYPRTDTEQCTSGSQGNPPPLDKPFQISPEIENILQYCWGMTMFFSHEKQQREVIAKLNDEILKIITKYDDELIPRFMMIMSGTLRNLGFAREAHVRYLRNESRKYENKRDLLEDISDLALSKESVPVKLASFFGAGLTSLFPNISVGLESLINAAPGVEKVLSFVVFGLLGILVVSVLFRIFTFFFLKLQEKKVRVEQNVYWNDKYLDNMAGILYVLYENIFDLLGEDLKPKSKPEEKDVKATIIEKILPKLQIDWTMWVDENRLTASTVEA